MLELSDKHFKDFKAAIITMLHEVKVNALENDKKKVLRRETEIIKKMKF